MKYRYIFVIHIPGEEVLKIILNEVNVYISSYFNGRVLIHVLLTW